MYFYNENKTSMLTRSAIKFFKTNLNLIARSTK